MSLKAQLTQDMKTAMKAGEKDRLGVIRLMQASVKQREVDERIELDDTQVMAVLEKMLKQRRDSVEQFEKAGREDLAAIERYEIGVIQAYLPEPMDEAELVALVDRVATETGAQGPQDMGRVMAAVKTAAAGRADMGLVSGLVKRRLAG